MTSAKELRNRKKEIEAAYTEVYTRIVGYYRPIQNWNIGKSQEYKERTNFDINSAITSDIKAEDVKMILFTQPGCAPCLEAKKLLENCEVEEVNAREDAELAYQYNIMATPTFIITDGKNILERTSEVAQIAKILENKVVK